MSMSNLLVPIGVMVPALAILAVITYVRIAMSLPITKKFKLIISVWLSAVAVLYVFIWLSPPMVTVYVAITDLVLMFWLCSYEQNIIK